MPIVSAIRGRGRGDAGSYDASGREGVPMGSCDALGYEIRPANAFQRGFQRGASTKAGAWVFSKTAHHTDRVLLSLTHGRTALATAMTGLPVMPVTTTGAKSGLPRALPLLGVPIDGD